jgi:DNA polymerase-3 subunit gamma/tau
MALLRVIHASSLPDPGDLVRRLTEHPDRNEPRSTPDAAPSGATVQALRPPPADNAPAPLPADFAALVALFEARREPRLAQLLHDEVRLVSYAPPQLTITTSDALPPDFVQRVMACLTLWTDTRWTVTLSRDAATGTTLLEGQHAALAAERAAALADPLVAQLLAAFPDGELVDIDAAEPITDDLRSFPDAQPR